jgi:hypothetical protein
VNAVALVGAVAALVSSVMAACTASTAGAAASGPVRYATQAGTFEAAFHAGPRTDVEKNPSQAFTTVARLAHGPVVSVTYRHGSPGLKSPYWVESVELVRLNEDKQAMAVSLLSAKLKYRFVDFDGARVAPVPFLSPFYSPELGVGELVVTPTGVYEVTADEHPAAARAFVASFAAPGFAGAQPIPLGQVAEVTGYEQVSVTNSSSGPVPVELSTGRADALAAVIDSLPAGPGTDCHEDELLYRVVFGPFLGARASYEADGHGCMSAVLVTDGARALSPRLDARCALFDAVAGVLPASAAGTLDSTACNPPRKAADGTIEGRLVRVGGPSPGSPVGLPGSVVANQALVGLGYPTTTGPTSTFKLSVPTGRYTLTGSSPKVLSDGEPLACAAEGPVIVGPGRTTSGVLVVCSIK